MKPSRRGLTTDWVVWTMISSSHNIRTLHAKLMSIKWMNCLGEQKILHQVLFFNFNKKNLHYAQRSLNKLLRRQTCERCDNGDNRNREASNYYYGSDDDGDDAGDDAGDDGNYDYSNWPAKNDCLTAMTMSLVCSKSDYALCKKTKLEKLGETRFHNLLSTGEFCARFAGGCQQRSRHFF
mgnify:CR=1 FL=1